MGLVPRRRQSGIFDHSGRVTKHGPSLLRKLLVEVAWIMRQHNPHAAAAKYSTYSLKSNVATTSLAS